MSQGRETGLDVATRLSDHLFPQGLRRWALESSGQNTTEGPGWCGSVDWVPA